MIRKNSLFCKLIRIKKSSAQLFREFMEDFSCEGELCPCCQAKGRCRPHAFYERNLIDFVNGRTVYSKICVLRIFCSACGHTHAVLPDLIVPYSTYGLFFILRVLAEYFAHLTTIEVLCARFAISPSMLYRWKGIFLLHQKYWLENIGILCRNPFQFIKQLCILPDYSSGFSHYFAFLYGGSFLQLHR